MNRHRLPILLVTLAVCSLAALLYAVNPEVCSWYPPCLLHKYTGLYCPGCGTTRAMYQLLHGHIGAALRMNAFVIIVVPVLIGISVLRPASTWRPSVVWTLVVMVLAFGLLRNIPAYPWTLLTPHP